MLPYAHPPLRTMPKQLPAEQVAAVHLSCVFANKGPVGTPANKSESKFFFIRKKSVFDMFLSQKKEVSLDY
jgi:hypothetical protein